MFGRRAKIADILPPPEWDMPGLTVAPIDKTLMLSDAKILSVDVETTGLEATDRILSIGWVPIVGGDVLLDQARHHVVDQNPGENEAASIHGLTHDQLAAGEPLERVLRDLLAALDGHILLAHHIAIEKSFLGRALAEMGGRFALWPGICTMTIEQNRLRRSDSVGQSARLAEARRRYGLPRYRAHHALVDAIAAAELFLAQAAHMADGPDSLLRPFIRW